MQISSMIEIEVEMDSDVLAAEAESNAVSILPYPYRCLIPLVLPFAILSVLCVIFTGEDI